MSQSDSDDETRDLRVEDRDNSGGTAVVSIEPRSCSTIRYPKGTRFWNSLLVRAALSSRCFSLAAVSSTASCCSEAPAQLDDAILEI